jgi:N-acetylmuramoyl-L-alanine amidase
MPLLLLALGVPGVAAAAQLQNLRLIPEGGSLRLVMSLDGQTSYKAFTLAHPDRVVVDLQGAKLAPGLDLGKLRGGALKDARHGQFHGALRIVLDLRTAARLHVFPLAGGQGFGPRVVVDMGGVAGPPSAIAIGDAPPKTAVAQAAKATVPVPQTSSSNVHAVAQREPSPPPAAVRAPRRKFIVAVDPGHGGRDSGAIGPGDVEEKNITLAIGKRLAKMIDAQPDMRAVLTRKGNYYVGLQQRVSIARKAQADLFVSIHCNSYPRDRNIHGTAVYVLSTHGASSVQARWLANQENAADMVGGIDLGNQNHQVAAVLLDISQSATLEASFDLAQRIMQSVSTFNALQKPYVQRAAFVVLKAPDIPSVLVETDFLTDPASEHRLETSAFQAKMAGGILHGIESYFRNYRPGSVDRPKSPLRTASGAHPETVAYDPSADH